MIESSTIIVLVGLVAMIVVLCLDKMRPGFTLLSCAIIFMATGVISVDDLVAGFSNKEMITIAMLFLIGEGVRQSGALDYAVHRILPKQRSRVGGMLLRLLPFITAISAVVNNTAVVVIFAPVIKRWANQIGVAPSKFLIPLSYATILGGMCTLIGTSTNMVVNGMMVGAGYRGFTMFELGKVGLIIAVIGILYIVIIGNRLLPCRRGIGADQEDIEGHWAEVILASRFPGVGSSLREFDFQRHYGAKVKAVYRRGKRVKQSLNSHILAEGDTLLLTTDDAFVRTWSESSSFHIVSYDEKVGDVRKGIHQRWLGVALLVVMVGAVTLGDLFGGIHLLPVASVVMVVMALTRLFPAKRYTKFITWDILIAIASAFAISKAMSNSGINTIIADGIMSVAPSAGNYGVLALLYLVTMLLTEVVTNNAAVAIAFPVAVALGEQMGIDPMPLFVAICIASSASFSSPIGYQTNLLVQGIGGYKFKDYLRIGLWLNLITFIVSIILIPRIWVF